MNVDKATAIGFKMGREFLPLFDELTTSDLQGCIEADVKKHGLTPAEQEYAIEFALQFIYKEKAAS